MVDVVTAQAKAAELIVSDDGMAEELLVDGYTGLSISNGVIRLNLYVDRFNSGSGKTERRVVKRLALPLGVFVQFHLGTRNLLRELARGGVISKDVLKQVGISDQD
jgi:hypothetical protein